MPGLGRVSQAAAIEALTGPQQIVAEQRDDFQRRRDFVVTALNRIDGLHCRRPEGAFYTFARCQERRPGARAPGALLANDADFCRYLLEDFEVAVVPSSVFGLAPCTISYATSMAQLEEAARVSRRPRRLRLPTHVSLPRWAGRAVGSSAAHIHLARCPHPGLPPEGDGAKTSIGEIT